MTGATDVDPTGEIAPASLGRRAAIHALILLCLGFFARADEAPETIPSLVHGYPIAHYFPTEAYGEHDQNWDVMQADNGLIYVANGHGLMAWDGERWRIHETPNRTRIRAFARGPDGLVYAGTTNDLGYFSAAANGGLAWQSLVADWAVPDREFGETWSVASNSRWVVFVTDNQLFVHDGDRVVAVPGFKPGANRVFAVDDRILMQRANANELLELVAEPELRMRVVSDGLPEDAKLVELHPAADGWLAATYNHGILRIGKRDHEVLTAPEDLVDGAIVYSSYIDGDGYQYLGTLKHGLFVVDPAGRVIRNFTQRHGLGTDTTLAITGDDQGNLWLAGAPGITRFVPTHRFSRYETEDDAKDLDWIVPWRDRLVLGGFGVYVIAAAEDPGEPPVFVAAGDLLNMQVWNVFRLGEELLLAARGGVLQARLDDTGAIAIDTVIVEARFAYEIVQVGDSNVLYTASSEGLHRIEKRTDGSWSAVQIKGVGPEMRHPGIENSDTVWIAAEDNRLLRVSDIDPATGTATIERFDASDGIGDRAAVPVVIGGRMLFQSPRGLLDHAPDRSPAFQPTDAFAALFPRAEPDLTLFMPDGSGRIWYEADGERFLATPTADGWRVDQALFATLPDKPLMGAFEYRPGESWLVFAGAGLHVVDLASISAPPVPPSLRLRSVRDLVTNDPHYLGQGEPALPELTQQNNSLRIRYALGDYRAEGRSEYRTRLLGSGADQWSEWSGESSKDYTLLAGGRYVFEVQARDGLGTPSEIARLPLRVRSSWYAEAPAVALYLVGGLLMLSMAVVAGSRWRKRQTRARQAALEALVIERTSALEEANRKLEKLAHSDGLTGLANRRQFDSHLQQLAADGTNAALLLVDVDRFKQYNDRHGHLAGDDLLRALTDQFTQFGFPAPSLVARFGGEEFAIVLAGSAGSRAAALAENLRERIDAALDVSVSIGVAVARLVSADDVNRLIGAADAGLYKAKADGRNRVVVNDEAGLLG